MTAGRDLQRDLRALGDVRAPTGLSGAVLAFYAFLGFEDMVNVAEEVRNVRRNLPRAIAATLALTMLLYGLVSLVAVLTLAPAEHSRFAWLPWREAAEKCFSWSNRDAILMLPEKLAR